MARKPWWHTTLEKRAQNPITTPKRKTNRDIYNEELRKLEKLAEKAQKAGIQVSYTPSKAKRIRQEQIKGIQTHGINLKREIQKAQTRQRNERRRQQQHEEAVERREQRKAQTAQKNERLRQQRHEEAVERREQRKAATRDKNERLRQQAREATAEKRKKAKERRELQKEFDKEARENEKIDKAQYRAQKKALEKQAKEAEKKRISAERKRARMDRANARAREKRAQAKLLKELQEKFPAQEQEKLTEPEAFPWGDLADFRFHYILSEIDSAIDVLQRSKRYSEYPVEELRDLLVEWYQDDPAEMLSELFATDTMQQLQTKDQLYSAVETGEIYALMERLTSEHDRLRQIHVVEDFGLLED